MVYPALGLIETKGLAGAIKATHAATGSGQVVIASVERSEAGFVTVKIEGEWGAVQAALEAGARAAEQAGELISMHVIPQTDNGLSAILPYRRFVAKYHPDQKLSHKQLARSSAEPRQKRKEGGKERAIPGVRAKPAAPSPRGTRARELPPRRPQVASGAPEPQGEKSHIDLGDLGKMPVAKLRRYARTIRNLPIQGRQISVANKRTLLEAIRSVMPTEPEMDTP